MDIYANTITCNGINKFVGGNRGRSPLFHENTITNCWGATNSQNALGAYHDISVSCLGRSRRTKCVGSGQWPVLLRNGEQRWTPDGYDNRCELEPESVGWLHNQKDYGWNTGICLYLRQHSEHY